MTGDVQVDASYTDPRLVALYDLENPIADDTEFCLALAAELDAGTIIDLGCGTGLLTRELATTDRRVIGVDPATAMLDVARGKPGADCVEWIEGDASAIPPVNADLAVMTGNVAQVFLDDDSWASTLEHLHLALRPGGYLTFESRNPHDRPWERWNRESTFEEFDSPNGPMQTWLEVVDVGDDRVQFEGHNVFLATGETLVAPSELRFRTRAELEDSLRVAGFSIEHLYGDWRRSPFVETSPLLVIVARR